MILRILCIVALITAAAAGWRLFEIQRDIMDLYQAPQGQVIGNPKGAFTIVELMDYRCPSCRIMDTTIRHLIETYPDLRIVIRHMPIYQEPSIHEARLALAAAKQGKFREMHEFLISHDDPVTDSEVDAAIPAMGIDPAKLKSDLIAPDISQILFQTLGTAEKYGFHTIPSFLIGGTYYSFTNDVPAYDDFMRVINQHNPRERK